jgi:hypothetical protein
MMDTEYFSHRELSGMQFSTYDQDNDKKLLGNCAKQHKGGWWFNNCYIAHLNGAWAPGIWPGPWYPVVTSGEDIKETAMMIKTY